MFARALRIPLLSLLLVAAMVAIPTPVAAGTIPSTASGEYSTPGGDCTVVFARFGVDHVNVDIWCPGTYSHSTAFAFSGACIGSPGVAFAFPLHGPDPASAWIAFDAFDGQRLSVRRGVTANQLYNGGGVAETWTMDTPVASPSPYACSGRSVRFRVFGR